MIALCLALRKTRYFVGAFCVLSAAISQMSISHACGGIFDVACNLQHGGMSPGNIVKQTQKAGSDVVNAGSKAVQDVANALNELQASVLTGPTLEQAILASRNTAINGAMPIPPHIRRQLTGYASEDSMNRVRYKIGDNGFVNLARLLEQGGLADAVTLIDVVVFRGPTEAADLSTWAHELTHVDQYAAGVHSFAVRYARNWQSIENPAYEKGSGFASWQRASSTPIPALGPMAGQPYQLPGQQQAQAGFPSGFGMQICGCYGPTTGLAPEPKCASGTVRINMCAGMCPGGGSPYAWLCE